MQPQLKYLRWSLLMVLAVGVGVVYGLHPSKAVDLHVYYTSARGYFVDGKPMYGPDTALGWPMIYRYPPLLLFLIHPMTLLPLRAVVTIWTALQVVLTGLFIRLWNLRFPSENPTTSLLISALLFLPYLVHELEIGNVQFLIVILVCFALLECDSKPFVCGSLLGIAAAIKIWPVFVVPYLVIRRHWKTGITAITATFVFTALPGFWLGWRNLSHLLAEWFAQERHINAILGDRWYPSLSLRGVMLRYLTVMNYSDLPDPNYRLVNVLSLPSQEVRHFWLVLAILLGLGSFVWTYRSKTDRLTFAVFFCFLEIIEPNVHRAAYVTLLWPMLVAGSIAAAQNSPSFLRWTVRSAAAVAALTPFLPGAANQRLVQVLGVDFFAVLLPVTLVVVWASRRSSSHADSTNGDHATKSILEAERERSPTGSLS